MCDGSQIRIKIIGGDSKNFSIKMRLHPGTTLTVFLFVLCDKWINTRYPSWGAMIYVSCIWYITDDETRSGVNYKLEVWRQILKSKGFKLSKTETKYLDCKFSVTICKIGVQVRLDLQVILNRTRPLIQENEEIHEDITHHICAG